MTTFKTEVHKPDEIKLSDYEKYWKEKDDVPLVDTAGFEPLKVRMQRMIEMGIVNSLSADDFDCDDITKMYMSPEFKITSEDDLEDIQMKLNARAQFVEELKAKYSKNEASNDIDKSDNSNKTEDTTKTTSEKD